MSEVQGVEPASGAPAIGPYSPGVRVPALRLLATSGQIPLDPATGALVAGGIREQADRALANLRAVLEAGGSGLDRVIRTTVYLQNLDDFATMNEVYARYFSRSPFPARTTVEVARLPRGALIEIDALALMNER